MARDAPELVIHNLIRDNWDASNTEGITPSIHHGWVDVEGEELEVTISNPNEVVLNETGYSGINVDGAPSKDYQDTVNVNVWADRRRSDENPRKMAWLMREEVSRILHDNSDAPGYDPIYVTDLGAQRFVEGEDDPGEETIWRYQVTAGLAYHVRPPSE